MRISRRRTPTNRRDGIAWVAGASAGIGRGVALELARRGYVVAASARRVGALRDFSTEASALNGRIDRICDGFEVFEITSAPPVLGGEGDEPSALSALFLR
ncbi:MAG TPA: hypothetical protein VKV96_16405 [Roseiarcus sp.]|nr:hypothetical protein [Roseiarcus sp.]